MNTNPTIKEGIDNKAEVGVETTRIHLQHVLEKEEEKGANDSAERARKRAINQLTGASIYLPPMAVPCTIMPEEDTITHPQDEQATEAKEN